MEHYSEILRRELLSHNGNGKTFSLRAFAQYLGIHPSALSRTLSRKQPLTILTAISISKRLGFNNIGVREFLQSVVDERIEEIYQTIRDHSDIDLLNG